MILTDITRRTRERYKHFARRKGQVFDLTFIVPKYKVSYFQGVFSTDEPTVFKVGSVILLPSVYIPCAPPLIKPYK